MKKSLVALAALAATTAFAQSSVTLYGRLDLGTQSQKETNNTGLPAALDSFKKTTELVGAHNVRTGSRVGVRGTEDLGGGLKANFVIETRVDPDSSASTFGTTRAGNLSLTGGFGAVVIGTYQNSFDDTRYAFNPNMGGIAGGDIQGRVHTGGALKAALGAAVGATPGATLTAAQLALIGGVGYTQAQFDADGTLGFSDRSTNSLGYRTPSFGGFDFRANISKQATNPGVDTTGYGIAAGYNNGPIGAVIAYGTAKNKLLTNTTSTGANKINDLGFSVKYDLGVAVPFFSFETSKNSIANTYIKVTSYETGAKFPLGAFTPYITFGGAKHKDETNTFAKSRAFQIGTTYDISKRTYVYGGIGRDRTNGTNGATFSNKRAGFAAGLVHSF